MGMFDTIQFNLPEGSAPFKCVDDAVLQTKSLRKNMDRYDFRDGTMLLKDFANHDTLWVKVLMDVVIPFSGAIVGYTLIDSLDANCYMRYFRFEIKRGVIQKTEEISQKDVDLFEKNFEAPNLYEAFAQAIKLEQTWRMMAAKRLEHRISACDVVRVLDALEQTGKGPLVGDTWGSSVQDNYYWNELERLDLCAKIVAELDKVNNAEIRD